ncbi:MAG TPA: C4-dicarboxylate ABC transporter substrate-binding protein, partial [Clostridia bacterium]|nr:C4-dicarboxylate ABC transporter substrate-binding protein [Clostridia bacterium]
YSLGFSEVAKYLILDAHVLNTTLWLAGTDWFDTLTAEQQGWLEESGNEAGLLSQELDKKMEAEAIQKLKDSGVTVYTPTEQDMEGFRAASMNFYEYPEIKSMFSPNLYDEILKAIGRTPK